MFGYDIIILTKWIYSDCLSFYIKNRTYYFYNDIIDIEKFDSSLLKIDKKSYKDIGIFNNGYIAIKKIGDCKNIYIVNPLYLRTTHASGYIEEENENKYLIFDSITFYRWK